MKISEIRELNTKELQERLDAESVQMNQLEIQHSVTPLDNPSKITKLRKDIAKMKTVIRQRELDNQ
ncbi:MAG: 50S ribosomal protein L29 [Bacteroidales bacterium]